MELPAAGKREINDVLHLHGQHDFNAVRERQPVYPLRRLLHPVRPPEHREPDDPVGGICEAVLALVFPQARRETSQQTRAAAVRIRYRLVLLPDLPLHFDHPADLPQFREGAGDRDDDPRTLQRPDLSMLEGVQDDPGTVEALRRAGAPASGSNHTADSGGNPVSAAVVEHLASRGNGAGGTPAGCCAGRRVSDYRPSAPGVSREGGRPPVPAAFAAVGNRNRASAVRSQIRPDALRSSTA